MKLHKVMLEQTEKFDSAPILQQLKADLADIGIKDPSFQGGFCFHAAARIFDALKEKNPTHDLKLYHKNGHVYVYDADEDKSFDSNGQHRFDDPHGQRGKIDHRWKTPAAMLKFLHAHGDSMLPDSLKGLQVLTKEK